VGCGCRRLRNLGLADGLRRNDAGRLCSTDFGLAGAIRVEPVIWSSIITVGLFFALAVNAMAGRIVVVGPLPGGAAGAH